MLTYREPDIVFLCQIRMCLAMMERWWIVPKTAPKTGMREAFSMPRGLGMLNKAVSADALAWQGSMAQGRLAQSLQLLSATYQQLQTLCALQSCCCQQLSSLDACLDAGHQDNHVQGTDVGRCHLKV